METLDEMIKRYIVTAAEIGANPNHKQLDAYERYAQDNDAEILVIPIEGQNSKDMDLHTRFDNYTVTSEYDLGNKIQIRDFRPKAQQINPLTGLRRFGATDASTIVGSTKQHLEMVANSNSCSPKAVMSTGASTLPNYNHNRIGLIGERDHRQGGIAVDVDTDTDKFFFRQIQNITDGSFIDQGVKYSSNRKSQQVRADTIVLGDLHVAQMMRGDYEAAMEMINEYKPKHVMLHDVFDAYAVSHHDNGKLLTRASKYGNGQLNLREELRLTGEVLHELASQGHKDTQYHIVKSNHDEHLSRYLDECRFTGDSNNLELSVRLAYAMLEGKDPVEEGIKLTYGHVPKNVKFLSRDDEFKRYGWLLSAHGDKGPSGSRGSPVSFEYSLGKAIIGHAHSAHIKKDIWRVGALLTPDVDYARGSAGAWTATNAVLYPNGKAQLQTSFDGEWYL